MLAEGRVSILRQEIWIYIDLNKFGFVQNCKFLNIHKNMQKEVLSERPRRPSWKKNTFFQYFYMPWVAHSLFLRKPKCVTHASKPATLPTGSWVHELFEHVFFKWFWQMILTLKMCKQNRRQSKSSKNWQMVHITQTKQQSAKTWRKNT